MGDKRDASGKVMNPCFNINAFLPLADQHTISPEPSSLDDLRAHGQRSLNLALFKSFPIRERFKVEVRMESTSVTNTPIFDAPGTNMNQTGTFGVITSAGGSRAVQGSARGGFFGPFSAPARMCRFSPPFRLSPPAPPPSCGLP